MYDRLSMRLLIVGALAALAATPAGAQAPRPAATAPRTAAPAAQPIPRATFLAQMDAQFRKMDTDHNGSLTRDEIEQFQRVTAAQELQERYRLLFARLDTDHNGQLSPAEFGRLQAAPVSVNAAPMLKTFDGNRDQAISLIEYRSGTLANFDRLDTDKDGVVSAAEMKAGGIGR